MTLPASKPRPGHEDVVLVVDDDPEVASAIMEALEEEGHDRVAAPVAPPKGPA